MPLTRRTLAHRSLAALAAASPLLMSQTASADPTDADTLRLGGQDIHFRLFANAAEDVARRPLILYCGGAGFTVARDGLWVAEALMRHADVLMWDYPGQGRSSGFPDPVTAERVVRGLAAHVDARYAGRPVVVWGHSLGGFVAAQIARHLGPGAVVLEATAPEPVEALEATGVRVPEAFRSLLPLLARYSIPAALEAYDGEVLVFGAGRDRTLPVRLSRELARAVDGAAYVENAGASHYGTLREARTHQAVAAMLKRMDAT